ncbi:Sperm-associated antigen 16 protein, partial [Ophiophagus hannah]
MGPFPITRMVNPVTVELKLPKTLRRIHPIFHCSLLKTTMTCDQPQNLMLPTFSLRRQAPIPNPLEELPPSETECVSPTIVVQASKAYASGTGSPLARPPNRKGNTSLKAHAFQKGDTIVSCDSYGVLKLWDVRRGVPMISIDAGPHPGNQVAFDPSVSPSSPGTNGVCVGSPGRGGATCMPSPCRAAEALIVAGTHAPLSAPADQDTGQ